MRAGVKHTPGPWETNAAGVVGPARGWDKPGDCIAEVAQLCSTDARNVGRSRGEQMANARLIAAAPDLLEACKALLSFYNADGLEPDITPCSQAEAAIRKAEGDVNE